MELAAALLDVVWQYQLPSGGLPRATDSALEQGDVLAQALRLASYLGATTRSRRGMQRLFDTTVSGPVGDAVPYWPTAKDLHENTWSTMFATQALDAASGNAVPDWRLLV
jgi:hypothetical protein